MLVIRLTRTGKKHDPHYRIVVQEKRSKLDGRSIAILGHYHPTAADKNLVINHEEAKMWISRGAQLSDTVNHLFVKDGILAPSAKKIHPYTEKAKEEVAEVKEEKAPKAEKNVTKEEVEEPEVEAEEPGAEEIAEEVSPEAAAEEVAE
jgi:small subunit ribosomal protein S16